MVAGGSDTGKESKASLASLAYNASVREYELFLRLLADRVLTARFSTGARVLDAGDFKAWLSECAEKAAQSGTLQEFFGSLT